MSEEGGLLMSSSRSPSLHLEVLLSPNASSRWERSPSSRGLAAPALSCPRWTLDFAKKKENHKPFRICRSVGGERFPLLPLLQRGFGLRRRKRLDEGWKHPGVQGVALNQALSHDALKEFRSGSDFRVFGQGFWVKTHPNVCPCLQTLLLNRPVQCEVTPPLASFPFCCCCLNYFLQTSPTTHAQFLAGCRGSRLLGKRSV